MLALAARVLAPPKLAVDLSRATALDLHGVLPRAHELELAVDRRPLRLVGGGFDFRRSCGDRSDVDFLGLSVVLVSVVTMAIPICKWNNEALVLGVVHDVTNAQKADPFAGDRRGPQANFLREVVRQLKAVRLRLVLRT